MLKLCVVDGCNREHSAKGYCKKHYQRIIMHGTLEKQKRKCAPLKERFQKFFCVAENGCWTWTGGKNKFGHGSFHIGGRSGYRTNAHRAAWLIYKGEIPEGMQVNHKCRTRHCVNPEHLYIGNQSDNMKDRNKDGNDSHLIRLAKERIGTKHHNAVLDEEKVRHIRTSKKSGPVLAKELGISVATVYQVRRRITWRHIE